MGTNNPSEEQLELVTGRIIELASALLPYVALEEDSYFDEAGIDGEMLAELSQRIAAYCGNVEGFEISLEDHPQPRRLARYLLENVDFEVLEPPLPAALLREPASVPRVIEADHGKIAGIDRRLVIAGLFLVSVLLALAIMWILSKGGAAEATAAATDVAIADAAHERTGGQHRARLNASGRMRTGGHGGRGGRGDEVPP
jgi:hypothetical protein